MNDKPIRERGTLKRTLPRRPIFAILFVGLLASTLAAQLSVYSSQLSDTSHLKTSHLTQREKWWIYFGIACLGSMETLVGILFGDSLSRSFAFGIAVITLGLSLGDLQVSLSAASPSIFLCALASIKPTRISLASLASILFLPVVFKSVITFKCISFVVNSAMLSSSGTPEFSLLPTFSVTVITLALMCAYVENRSHKNGSLLNPQMKSLAIIVAACGAFSSVFLCRAFPIEGLVFLLGSLFTLLTCLFFAAVADVWYAVGSGQFQMVSLDTAGMMIYFILPAVLLYFRFLDRYGETISDGVAVLVEKALTATGISQPSASGQKDSLFMILSFVTAVGVPIINSLCPMGGYLFSRAYMHGQPNTKKVALCVNFSDIQAAEADLFESMGAKKYVLNICVTLEDLQSSPKRLKELLKKGHHLVLSPGEYPGWGLSLFQGQIASCTIESAFNEYLSVFGEKPSWCLSRSTDSLARHPAFLRKAQNLGMKIVYWSTLVQVESVNLSEEQKTSLVKDVMDKNGGSILYVTLDDGASKDRLTTSVLWIVDELRDFSVCPLSEVVRDDATMAL
eukprot:CCRYP_013525-RA/>CCRYP_013525-RA protein AED:0.01 eAED:0.01 QI:126/1/1/1/1/1/2/859/565